MFRELFNWWRYPHLRGLVQMSYGIKKRHERCAGWWEGHIRCTREFIKSKVNSRNKGGTITILGAGRCFDLDLGLLSEKFDKIHLCDADPNLIPFWKELQSSGLPITYEVVDLTGCLKKWTGYLNSHYYGKLSTDQAINLLTNLPDPDPIIISGEVVLSLNLLSQLPLFWRDSAYDFLKSQKLYDPETEQFASLELEMVMKESLRTICQNHINLLSRFKNGGAIIVTDLEWYYYQREISEWQVVDALYGLGSNFNLADTWLWHVAPQGIENSDYGVIHKVGAFKL